MKFIADQIMRRDWGAFYIRPVAPVTLAFLNKATSEVELPGGARESGDGLSMSDQGNSGLTDECFRKYIPCVIAV